MIVNVTEYAKNGFSPATVNLENIPAPILNHMAEALYNYADEYRAEQGAADRAQMALDLISAMVAAGISSSVTDQHFRDDLEMIIALAPVGW